MRNVWHSARRVADAEKAMRELSKKGYQVVDGKMGRRTVIHYEYSESGISRVEEGMESIGTVE